MGVKNDLRGLRVVDETPEFVTLEASAGEVWDDVVRHCTDRNWGGIENLAMIPGTIGAAPVQNIGAYGVELKDVLVSVQGLMRSEEHSAKYAKYVETTLHRDECGFGYRDSVFKRSLRAADGSFVVTSVTMRLRKNPSPTSLQTRYGAIEEELKPIAPSERTIADVSAAVRRIRSSKLPNPAELGNAGSFFKNPEIPRAEFERISQRISERVRASNEGALPSFPASNGDPDFVKIPAGWLIEQCGWKGKRVGNTGAHAAQALVLVNYGAASGAEVHRLSQDIRASVLERFGVTIETEVNIL